MTELLEKLRAALADHYTVERELGEGGMAIVYLAQDIKHERQVAVKVLRPELAVSLGADRFLREIKIAAKLTHPHILPLYDSGEADGLLYYVMPFVEGESLRDLLDREQQLPLEDAVRIAREAAGALGQAHSFGIIHRDIKPENIMLSAGHAVVADFGIARAFSAAGGDNLTQTGMAVGTPAYMSPEQAAGDPNLDGRSDVYALGCVLYEMLVGQAPFTGPNAQAIMARHTMDAVTPPSIMRQSVPEELEDVILRSMEKAPADRFKTASDFAEALVTLDSGSYMARRTTRAMIAPRRGPRKRGVVAVVSAVVVMGLGIAGWQFWPRNSSSGAEVSGGLDPRNVAVLYFEDRSTDGEWTHVADGMTEGLIRKLSEVSVLDVISANGVAPLKNSELSRDSIARMLNAGSLVEGSVEPAGDDLRVTMRLIEGSSGAHFERATFQIAANQLLVAQDSVVESVARLLRQRLGEEIRVRQRRMATQSVEAWGFVQRAERLRKDARNASGDGDDQTAALALGRADSVLVLAEEADTDWKEPKLLRGWVAQDRAMLERGDAQVPFLEAGMRHVEAVIAESNAGSQARARALELRGSLRFRLFSLQVTPDRQEWENLLYDARDDLEEAVAIDASLVDAQLNLSRLRYHQLIDDVPGALAAARAAYERDAFLDNSNALLDRMFWSSLDLEAFSEARRWCVEGARRFPDDFRFARCRLWLMASPAVANPDVEEAAALVEKLDAIAPTAVHDFLLIDAEMVYGGVLGKAGLKDSALTVLSAARSRVTPENDEEDRFLFVEAIMRSFAGDLDEGIDLLRRYVAAHPDHHFVESQGTVFWYRDLRAHPRWREVASMGQG